MRASMSWFQPEKHAKSFIFGGFSGLFSLTPGTFRL
jgi:hypothetical protein